MELETVTYKDISVSYLPCLDGGGMGFGQEYIDVIKERFGKVGCAFEFCSGPGFIGFSMLANGLCDRLTLADINPEAVKICKETVKKNGLGSKVSVYLSDCLDNIPYNEKWDLVVGNPPHWASLEDANIHEGKAEPQDIKKFDIGLNIHKKFYKTVRKYLNTGASILMQENSRATKVEDFTDMIYENGFKVIETFKARPLSITRCILQGKKLKYAKPSPYYFIWIK